MTNDTRHNSTKPKARSPRVFAAMILSASFSVAPAFGQSSGVGADIDAPFPLPVSAAASDAQASASDAALDPFLAGTLGIIPFSSGLYLTDKPARGIVFTAVDVLLALGVYSARYTVNGNPDNARNYFLMMAANNVIDALISVRYANIGRGTALILPGPDGGFQGAVHWRF